MIAHLPDVLLEWLHDRSRRWSSALLGLRTAIACERYRRYVADQGGES